MTTPDQRKFPAEPTGRRWPWFAAGFLVVFFGMAVTTTMYTMQPSGQSIEPCKLWKYYADQVRRAFARARHGAGERERICRCSPRPPGTLGCRPSAV